VLDDLITRLEALPSVTSAGAISWLPLTTTGGSNALFVEGHPLPGPGEETYVVVPSRHAELLPHALHSAA
jgi:hypothetical protein